jgi:hypothetical protein
MLMNADDARVLGPAGRAPCFKALVKYFSACRAVFRLEEHR